MRVFVDTSAWYAAADASDASHIRATARLSEFSGELLTSDHVLVETWYLASVRLGHRVAEELVTGIRSGVATMENTLPSDLEAALTTGTVFPDQDFSIVDRTSWALMLRLGLRETIAFDRDFSIFRFGPNRSEAFTVHA